MEHITCEKTIKLLLGTAECVYSKRFVDISSKQKSRACSIRLHRCRRYFQRPSAHGTRSKWVAKSTSEGALRTASTEAPHGNGCKGRSTLQSAHDTSSSLPSGTGPRRTSCCQERRKWGERRCAVEAEAWHEERRLARVRVGERGRRRRVSLLDVPRSCWCRRPNSWTIGTLMHNPKAPVGDATLFNRLLWHF